jgi:hypothetical protein
MALVENALKKNPDVSVPELYEAAKKVSPSVRRLSRRQFHARYPLQIKRRKAQGTAAPRARARKAAAKTPRRGREKAPESQRDAVRQVFLQFASDMAAADDRKDLVKVLAGVDRYVDQVVKAR